VKPSRTCTCHELSTKHVLVHLRLVQVVKFAEAKGLSILGLVEGEPQVTEVQDDPQTPGKAIVERLVNNGCSSCNYFAVCDLVHSEKCHRLPTAVGIRSTVNMSSNLHNASICMQIDNLKLGKVLNEGVNTLPFQV
jgi:hypothetical protein